MSDAMSKYAQYQKNPFDPKMVQNQLSQENDGQSGIMRRHSPSSCLGTGRDR
jgi:hypothetical protein